MIVTFWLKIAILFTFCTLSSDFVKIWRIKFVPPKALSDRICQLVSSSHILWGFSHCTMKFKTKLGNVKNILDPVWKGDIYILQYCTIGQGVPLVIQKCRKKVFHPFIIDLKYLGAHKMTQVIKKSVWNNWMTIKCGVKLTTPKGTPLMALN